MDLQPIQVPRALMDILMFEHGVHYRQTVICTEVKKKLHNIQVQMRQAISRSVIAYAVIEVSQ